MRADQGYIALVARGDGFTYWRGGVCWISYSHRGERFREPAAQAKSRAPKDREAAEKAARAKLKARLAEIGGARFIGPAAERVTVADCLASLVEDLELRKAKSVRSYRYHVKPVREALGRVRVFELTSGMAREYQRARLTMGRAPATINREIEALRQALNLAKREGRIGSPPYLPLLRIDNARQGWFERKELEAICRLLPWHIAEAARFGIETGWRLGEILPLRWDQVDRGRGEIRLATSKNRHPRAIPIAGGLRTVIDRAWARRKFQTYGQERISLYVFHRYGRPVKDISKPWNAARVAAGLPGKLFHDLRRTAVKEMADAGIDQATIMEIAGHRTDAMFRRYRIVTHDRMRQAMEHRADPEGRLVGFRRVTGESQKGRRKR